MLSKIEEKRTMYTGSTLDPNNFQSAADFRTAIQTIDTSLYLILSPQKKLAKRAATEEAQLTFVEALESLKKQIIEHPNFVLFTEKEEQAKIQQEIEAQGKIIKSDEQLLSRVTSIIPSDHKIKNKIINQEKFLTGLTSNIRHGKFDEDLLYGDYERYTLGGMVLGVLDLKQKHQCYALILNMAYSVDTKLCLYRLRSVYTKNKPEIKPSILLSDDYLNPQQITTTENITLE